MSWPVDIYVGCLARQDVPGSKTWDGPGNHCKCDDVMLRYGQEVIVLDMCQNFDGYWAWFYKIDTGQFAWTKAQYLEMII